MAAAKKGKDAAVELPAVGAIYSFRTKPLSQFASPETGRYAAFKVVDVTGDLVVLAVLEGIWTSPPDLEAVGHRNVLRERRFEGIKGAVSGGGRMAAFGLWSEFWNLSVLDRVALVGTVILSGEDSQAATQAAGIRYAPLQFIDSAAEGEWRWKHDREALLAERQKSIAKDAAEQAAKEQRYRTRLKSLTWEKFLAETPFERWSPSPPFPPKEFTEAARQAIVDACRELTDLGPKPSKAKVRSILRRCVEWFNEADGAAGQVIETEEREDICAVLEEMAFLAKQKSLADEIGDWRDW